MHEDHGGHRHPHDAHGHPHEAQEPFPLPAGEDGEERHYFDHIYLTIPATAMPTTICAPPMSMC